MVFSSQLIWEFDQMGKKKKEVIQLDRESVIPILKPKLTQELTKLIGNFLLIIPQMRNSWTCFSIPLINFY